MLKVFLFSLSPPRFPWWSFILLCNFYIKLAWIVEPFFTTWIDCLCVIGVDPCTVDGPSILLWAPKQTAPNFELAACLPEETSYD